TRVCSLSAINHRLSTIYFLAPCPSPVAPRLFPPVANRYSIAAIPLHRVSMKNISPRSFDGQEARRGSKDESDRQEVDRQKGKGATEEDNYIQSGPATEDRQAQGDVGLA